MKFKAILIFTYITFCISFAQTYAADQVTVPMSAQVEEQLELKLEVYKGEPGQGTQVTDLDFGIMAADGQTGPLRGRDWYTIVLTPNTSSRKYKVTQTASSLTNGEVSLPAGACIMTPWATDLQGNAYPSGHKLGQKGSFVATDKLIYQSEDAGSSRQIPVTYAVVNSASEGATEFVPNDQPSGNYSSSVTFQVVLVN